MLDILSLGVIISSVLTITSKNPVVAVIFLISVFVNAAGYLILSSIGFIGITYIILYVGAITVLFLFVIMMINIKLSDILETGNQYTKNLPLALIVGSLFIYEIFSITPFTFNNVSSISYLLNVITDLNNLFNFFMHQETDSSLTYIITEQGIETNIVSFLQIQSIGIVLYTYGASWLLLCSIILLLSMVAPIFISRTNN